MAACRCAFPRPFRPHWVATAVAMDAEGLRVRAAGGRGQQGGGRQGGLVGQLRTGPPQGEACVRVTRGRVSRRRC